MAPVADWFGEQQTADTGHMSVALEKVRRWVDNEGRHPCVACGCLDRIIQKESPAAILPAPNGQQCAVAVVICARCARIELYSALRMGIKPEDVKG
jgi:hypothetical protein